MRRRSMGGALVIAGLVGVLAVGACGRRSEQDGSRKISSDLDSMAFRPESAQVRADIDSGNAQFLQAWRVGSGDLFANAFAEDGAQLLQGGRYVQGRDSITAYMGRVFSRLKLRRGSITTDDLTIIGDRAYERGRYVFEIGDLQGSRTQIDSGQYMVIWKYEQGQWKMWRDVGVPRAYRP